MKAYRCQEICRLAHELAMSPLRHRLRQVAAIMRVIDLIEQDREYPYSFVCFRITGYRPRRTADSLLGGKNLITDLVRMLDGLTAANPLPAAAKDRLLDADAAARRLNVSVKTISRWRERGLAGCWYWFDDGAGRGQSRLAFTEKAVESFVCRHRDLVRRGSAFTFMRPEERQRVIDRARELVTAERCSLHAVALRLAEETGRAVETIRCTLRKFDQQHPDEALFDCAGQAALVDAGELIYEAHLAGQDVRSLAASFGKREAEIRRILTLARAKQLAARPVEYIYNPAFDSPDAARLILDEAPFATSLQAEGALDNLLARPPSELPAYMSELYRTPLLGRDEERGLFRKMNFLLHQAELHRQKIAASPDSASDAEIAAVGDWLDQAREVKNRITRANLRLVVSIAKRHLRGRPEVNLYELISDGNIALMRAVDKFDYARGFRFSTYASWAVMRSYARTVPDELAHAGRFQTGREELLAGAGDYREQAEPAAEEEVRAVRAQVAHGLEVLDDRERSVVVRHFGLEGAGGGKTLDAIGRELGLSKERVRQIELRALSKLRHALTETGAALLAG